MYKKLTLPGNRTAFYSVQETRTYARIRSVAVAEIADRTALEILGADSMMLSEQANIEMSSLACCTAIPDNAVRSALS